MKITPFHPSHFAAIRPNYIEREVVDRVTPEYLANLAAEPSCTLWIDGRPMAVAGVIGDCEIWSLVDEEIRPHKFTLYRAAKKFLGEFGWLFANVDNRLNEGCRWLEHLGFQRVGVRERGGRHFIRYERAS